MNRVIECSVIVPTIGRPDLLLQCVSSLLACRPGPTEIIVADQSAERSAASVLAGLASDDATVLRVVPADGRGAARCRNVGARHATMSVLLFVDDDCTVRNDWVGRSTDLVGVNDQAIATGAVLPIGDKGLTPSLRDEPEPAIHRSHGDWSLWSGNMAVARDCFEDVGGFDERFQGAAEDLDFAYRWFEAGRVIHYEPNMVAWHHDWRDEGDMDDVHRRYARGLGQFYGMHFAAGDRAMIGLAWQGIRPALAATVRRRRSALDGELLARLPHLPLGFVTGWRQGLESRILERLHP